MISASPKISVIMTTLNSGRFVTAAVSSIIAQSFRDWELLVVDGGSQDSTVEQVHSLNDIRISVIEQKGLRRCEQLNIAIGEATADVLAIMDSDDVAIPERFAIQYAELSKRPEVDVLGSWALLIDEGGRSIEISRRPVEHEEILKGLFTQRALIFSTTMWRRSLVTNANPFPRDLTFGEDVEWYFRISSFARFANLPRVLMQLRQRADSRSRTADPDSRKNLMHHINEESARQISNAKNSSESARILRTQGIASYYYGSAHQARHLLADSIRLTGFSLLAVRYLIPSFLLGDRFLPLARRMRILRFMATLFRRLDLHSRDS